MGSNSEIPQPEDNQPGSPVPASSESHPAPGLPLAAVPGAEGPEEAALYGEEDEIFTEEMLEAALMEDFGDFAPTAEGEVVMGKVLQITPSDVIVDFGFKSEGIVPLSQFSAIEGVPAVAVGDTIEVMVEHGWTLTPEGYVPLSHRKAQNLRAWETLEQAHRDNLLVNGRVVSRTKGGLLVDVGVQAFMPGSQVDVRPVYNLDAWIGQDIPVRILKLNRRRGNVVVSRKAALGAEISDRKAEILQQAKEGTEVVGIVKNLTDYGAFIDLGGIDGLLHVSDMSYGRVNHPSEMLQIGQELTLKVLKFDPSKERISLGLKQMAPDPWDSVSERYPIGSRVIGRVVSITDYGAFVELEPGVEGLIHISEMTWSRRMKHPSKLVKVGDTVECVVLDIKPHERRASLGIKQLEADPWTTVEQRYSIGSVVEGRVRKLADFGAFVEIEEGIDGLIHISDLSWTKHVKHPSEVLKKGQVLQAVVLSIDAGGRRLSLGVKQLQPDQWESFFQSHQPGDMVRGKVCRTATFGVFVEVAPGVEALCHNSEIPSGGREKTALSVGEELSFKVIRMSPGEKKIGLSLKGVAEDQERERMAEYQRQAAAASQAAEQAARTEAESGELAPSSPDEPETSNGE